MIEVKNLTKTFDGVKAINNLSVEIRPGITGIVGEDGTGKSTFLRIIAGIFYPTSGSVQIDGYSASSKEAKERIFFLSDDPYLPNGGKVMDIYDFYSCFYEVSKDKFVGLIKEAGLPLDKEMAKFSKGMRRQAFIALALSVNCPYIFLDEAFDGLDPLILDRIKSEIIAINDNDRTIIISSHNISVLEKMADRTLVLYNGTIAKDGTAEHFGQEIIKYQMACDAPVNEKSLSDLGIEVIAFKKVGSIFHFVVVDDKDNEEKIKSAFHPLLLEQIPISAEEIVLFEMLLAKKGVKHE